MPETTPAMAAADLTTVHVYELALKLRNQFDALIQAHGSGPYEGIVPLVVRTLEQLECVTKQCDVAREEVEELRFSVERLQTEKRAKAVEREKYQKELEVIEETWQSDAKVQRDLVLRLQSENHRLSDVIKNKLDDVESHDRLADRETGLEGEIEGLKARLQRQREDLRALERELGEKGECLEELQSQLDHARKQASELKRRSLTSAAQVQALIEDKSDLQASLHDKELQLVRIKQRLRRSSSNPDDDPLAGKPLSDEELSRLVARLSVDNKMIIDLNDADVPRFTLADVSDVMNERNQLKQQVIGLEEELAQFKPDFAKLEESALLFSEEEVDPPVQGPINREPDEKLYPERYRVKGSGIRKLFKRFIDKIETTKLLKFNDDADDDDE